MLPPAGTPQDAPGEERDDPAGQRAQRRGLLLRQPHPTVSVQTVVLASLKRYLWVTQPSSRASVAW